MYYILSEYKKAPQDFCYSYNKIKPTSSCHRVISLRYPNRESYNFCKFYFSTVILNVFLKQLFPLLSSVTYYASCMMRRQKDCFSSFFSLSLFLCFSSASFCYFQSIAFFPPQFLVFASLSFKQKKKVILLYICTPYTPSFALSASR